MSQPTNRQAAPSPKQPPRKKRRRRRMNPFLYLLVVVASAALLAGLSWMAAGDVLALNKSPLTAVVEIKEGDDLGDVAALLKDQGLIEYKPLFRVFCTMTSVKTSSSLSADETDKKAITPGSYELDTDMDYRALINGMSASSTNRKAKTVTIPEGYNVDQIFSLLEENGISTIARLRDAAANHDFNFSFLKGIVALGDYHRLEGYLFPDTYEFYMGDDPIQILNKMILGFDSKFTDALRTQATDMGYTVRDIVTIASLIEKETDGNDQAHIASVIYNRLKNPSAETAGFLNIDAAIAYVTGRTVTTADYQGVDSPYNTYLNKGLPPGPIANPGMVALNAALNPDKTKDYYYMLGSDGAHHFFKTNKELVNFKGTQGGAGNE